MADSAVFLDGRGDDRALRLSWHAEAGLVVLSMWRENVCVGSFRSRSPRIPAMIAFLSSGLGGGVRRPPRHPPRLTPGSFGRPRLRR